MTTAITITDVVDDEYSVTLAIPISEDEYYPATSLKIYPHRHYGGDGNRVELHLTGNDGNMEMSWLRPADARALALALLNTAYEVEHGRD